MVTGILNLVSGELEEGGGWWGKLIGGRVCPAQQTPITGITDTSHFTLKPPSFSKWATTSNS